MNIFFICHIPIGGHPAHFKSIFSLLMQPLSKRTDFVLILIVSDHIIHDSNDIANTVDLDLLFDEITYATLLSSNSSFLT